MTSGSRLLLQTFRRPLGKMSLTPDQLHRKALAEEVLRKCGCVGLSQVRDHIVDGTYSKPTEESDVAEWHAKWVKAHSQNRSLLSGLTLSEIDSPEYYAKHFAVANARADLE